MFSQYLDLLKGIDQIKDDVQILFCFRKNILDESEIEKIISDLKSDQPDLNMGMAMKVLKERYAGQYDGKVASGIAKRMLG